MVSSDQKDRVKVSILTSVHIPFDGRIFHKEAKTLARAGYEVVLIAPVSKEQVVDGVRILPLPTPRNRFERMTKVMWKLLRMAVKEGADVYHFHDPELMPVGLALKLLGKKTIWDVHEHYPNSILDKYWISKGLRYSISKLFDVFERIFAPFFDYVVYTTPVVGARYKKMNVRAERIENYPIVELSNTFEKNPQKNVIYLGGMSKIRGTIELITAFGLVAENHPEWKLCLVGKASPPSFEKEIKRSISKSNLCENIDLVPWVPYEEKERLSSQASIGVVTYLPYSNNISCLPNKLFEYMLVGLPVIVSAFPLYKEIVNKDKCGLTVDPSNPEEIAKAVTYLIEHPDEARKMGENGKRAVLEKYNWENEGKKLLGVYEEVLENGRRRVTR